MCSYGEGNEVIADRCADWKVGAGMDLGGMLGNGVSYEGY